MGTPYAPLFVPSRDVIASLGRFFGLTGAFPFARLVARSPAAKVNERRRARMRIVCSLVTQATPHAHHPQPLQRSWQGLLGRMAVSVLVCRHLITCFGRALPQVLLLISEQVLDLLRMDHRGVLRIVNCGVSFPPLSPCPRQCRCHCLAISRLCIGR